MTEEYSPDNLSKSESYGFAAKKRRRTAIQAVIAASEELSIKMLARDVAAREHDTSPDAIDKDTHRQVQVTLFHQDLPKLAEEYIITFNRTEQTIASGEAIDDLAPLLSSGDASE